MPCAVGGIKVGEQNALRSQIWRKILKSQEREKMRNSLVFTQAFYLRLHQGLFLILLLILLLPPACCSGWRAETLKERGGLGIASRRMVGGWQGPWFQLPKEQPLGRWLIWAAGWHRAGIQTSRSCLLPPWAQSRSRTQAAKDSGNKAHGG